MCTAWLRLTLLPIPESPSVHSAASSVSPPGPGLLRRKLFAMPLFLETGSHPSGE